MDNSDVKVGMKVVPHRKSGGAFGTVLSDSIVWRNAQAKNQRYLFVAAQAGYWWILNDVDSKVVDGDYFLSTDFDAYEE